MTDHIQQAVRSKIKNYHKENPLPYGVWCILPETLMNVAWVKVSLRPSALVTGHSRRGSAVTLDAPSGSVPLGWRAVCSESRPTPPPRRRQCHFLPAGGTGKLLSARCPPPEPSVGHVTSRAAAASAAVCTARQLRTQPTELCQLKSRMSELYMGGDA